MSGMESTILGVKTRYRAFFDRQGNAALRDRLSVFVENVRDGWISRKFFCEIPGFFVEPLAKFDWKVYDNRK